MTDLLDEAALQRDARRKRVAAVVMVVAVVGGAGGFAWQLSQFETLIITDPFALIATVPPRPEATGPAPSKLGAVDLHALHTERLGRWTIEAQNGGRVPAAEDVVAAIRSDARLSALFQAIEDTAETLDYDSALELTRLFSEWSAYLDEAGAPWFVTLKADTRGGDWRFYLKIYEVLGDTRVTVGATTSRVRIMRRVDRINVRDGMLGHSGLGDAGAVLVLDNLVRSFVREVWPALGDPETSVVPSFAAAVRRDAARMLSEADFEILAKTAGARARITEALDAIRERRQCSRFRLRGHWYGLTFEALDGIEKVARRKKEPTDCPPLTVVEALRLAKASRTLQTTDGLAEAVAAGVAWYARAVALHEARHIADGAVGSTDRDAGPNDVPCPGCAREIGKRSRVELSAYAAELTHPDTATLALLQMCAGLSNRKTRFRQRAEGLLLDEILPEGCDAGVPDDLVARGRRTDAKLFGRQDVPAFADGWPARLSPWTRTDW